MGRKDKALIKENQKKFFLYECQNLLRNGFKRSKGAYWRIAGDEVLQIVVPGLLKEENENIFFDLIPLYSYIPYINEKEIFELPKLNIKDICKCKPIQQNTGYYGPEIHRDDTCGTINITWTEKGQKMHTTIDTELI